MNMKNIPLYVSKYLEKITQNQIHQHEPPVIFSHEYEYELQITKQHTYGVDLPFHPNKTLTSIVINSLWLHHINNKLSNKSDKAIYNSMKIKEKNEERNLVGI